jgi:hypothetical protein
VKASTVRHQGLFDRTIIAKFVNDELVFAEGFRVIMENTISLGRGRD